MQVPQELIDFINTASNFLIAGHKESDGDCVGSILALCSGLRRLKKNAIPVSNGPFDRPEVKKYEEQFTFYKDIVLPDKSNTKAIIVDCTSMDRTGDKKELIKQFPFAVIDHHSTTDYNNHDSAIPVYIDKTAPACTMLIEKVLLALGLELTKEEASLILFGICTDTGFFRHLTENNPEIFETAARMARLGASPKKCYRDIYGGKSLGSRILTGHILSKTESFFDGKLLLSYETLEDNKKFGFESRDSDMLYQLLQSVKDVQAIAIIRQECDNSCTVSLRSADIIDVSKVASVFGGGGHKNAAGLTMLGDLSNVKKIILKTFSEVFNNK